MSDQVYDKEMSFIKNLAGKFPRHPKQLNQLYEADAEILDFKNGLADYLVFKCDGIHEEIRAKLYEDPYLIGWMAVTVTISDLAAVGSDPLGILISLQLPKDSNESWIQKFQQGVNEACAVYDTKILGGDTNFDSNISVATTGIGTIEKTLPLLRKNINPGDFLYATAPLGKGNAFAYSRFFDSSLKLSYQPVARLKESKLIRKYAGACIDTSDGLFPALSILGELNNTGLKFSGPLEDILSGETANICNTASIPAWFFLAGPHGEYELLFTIPPSIKEEFEKELANEEWHPVLLGEITAERGLEFFIGKTHVHCNPSAIANMFGEAEGNILHYFQMLNQKHEQWTKPKSVLC